MSHSERSLCAQFSRSIWFARLRFLHCDPLKDEIKNIRIMTALVREENIRDALILCTTLSPCDWENHSQPKQLTEYLELCVLFVCVCARALWLARSRLMTPLLSGILVTDFTSHRNFVKMKPVFLFFSSPFSLHFTRFRRGISPGHFPKPF